MSKKQKSEVRRRDQGDQFVILVDSPFWPAGSVLQFVIREFWYGHDCISEFEEGCKRDGCTILHMKKAPIRDDGRARYLTDAEVERALRSQGLWTHTRAARALEEAASVKEVKP